MCLDLPLSTRLRDYTLARSIEIQHYIRDWRYLANCIQTCVSYYKINTALFFLYVCCCWWNTIANNHFVKMWCSVSITHHFLEYSFNSAVKCFVYILTEKSLENLKDLFSKQVFFCCMHTIVTPFGCKTKTNSTTWQMKSSSSSISKWVLNKWKSVINKHGNNFLRYCGFYR